MAKQADLMQGTLEMLILKAVSLGKLHGYVTTPGACFYYCNRFACRAVVY